MAKKNKEEKKITLINSSFLLGFGFTVLFLIYCLAFLPIRYETNDELANIMRLVTQGGVTPEATSPVLSLTLGHILVTLYKTVSNIPWYGITNFLALYFGISLITTVFIRNSTKPIQIIFCPFFLFYAFHCFAFVSFTAAALIKIRESAPPIQLETAIK